ncbi:MAG: DUF5063 domain-containing protein [Bacteroidales bacterium]|nr:DUF5063 domain-containing protein [Bacteroidales bacterium]
MSYKEIIYSKNVVEFVTVGVEYCLLLERATECEPKEFIDRAVKILPLLYLKATLLPECAAESDDSTEEFVTEESYAMTVNSIASLLKEKDDYLETFHPEMKFSDTPVLASISEDLADIYQDVKNFVSSFSIGHEISMNDALVACKENFGIFWGQKLVNALGALHHIRFNADESESYEPEEDSKDYWL